MYSKPKKMRQFGDPWGWRYVCKSKPRRCQVYYGKHKDVYYTAESILGCEGTTTDKITAYRMAITAKGEDPNDIMNVRVVRHQDEDGWRDQSDPIR